MSAAKQDDGNPVFHGESGRNGSTKLCKLLENFEMHGWEPNPELSDDENFMDMVLIVTRSSHCQQGGMACVLVQPGKSFYDSAIISVTNNGPLFSESDSDIHAEVAALGHAARTGAITENATAYITMPPCKRCFAALVVSGVKRIVSRLTPPKTIVEAAKRHQIEMVALDNLKEQMARINILIYGNPQGKKRVTSDNNPGNGLNMSVENRPRRKRTKEKCEHSP
jgi:deoxycytidylate deaminase